MSSSAGLLEFFVLEASEYTERLDGVLGAATASGPDPESLLRYARMLRGSATMAKVQGIADLAAALERVGRALREGALRWDPALHGAVIAAIDDVKLLVRSVRSWGPAEEQRAQARTQELSRYAPQTVRGVSTPSMAGGGFAFLAAQAAEIAAGLDQYVLRPDDRGALGALLGSVRALRGVAAIRDLPPIADVVEAVERAAKPLELEGTLPHQTQLALFHAAARLLGRAAVEMRSGGRPDPTAPEVQRFAAAAAALDESVGAEQGIVPIATLFHTDPGPHIVFAAPNPPTTPTERFRLEVVSQAEHLRRLVADARPATDAATRGRLGRELRGALQALGAAAEGFGEYGVADFVHTWGDAVVALDPRGLDALDRLAHVLANASTRPEELHQLLAQLAQPAQPTPSAPASAAPAAARRRTPTGPDLAALLEHSIAGLSRLTERPLSDPVPIVDANVVPIDTLLYRGRAALDRALQVRDALRRHGGGASPEELQELFDLLDLAASE